LSCEGMQMQTLLYQNGTRLTAATDAHTEGNTVNIMTANGPRDLYTPKYVRAAHARIRAEREKVEALNGSIASYNRTVEAAHEQNRVIGWFPRQVNQRTGEVFDWGPKPERIMPAPLMELPEWAKVQA